MEKRRIGNESEEENKILSKDISREKREEKRLRFRERRLSNEMRGRVAWR